MKRSLETLDILNLKLEVLSDDINRAQHRVVRHKHRDSKREVTAFIQQNCNKNVFLSYEAPLVSPDQPPLIFTSFDVPQVASRIISTMGPMELCVLTRVCRQFKEVTTLAFLELAPHFLDRYKEEVTDPQLLGAHKKDKEKLGTLICNYIQRLTANMTTTTTPVRPLPPIEALLALWYRIFRFYRQHGKGQQIHQWSDYIFVYNSTTGRFSPLRAYNLYKSDQKPSVTKSDIVKQWHTKYSFPFPEKEEPLEYIRSYHLDKMALKPLGGQSGSVNDLFMVEGERLVIFNEHLSSLFLHYVSPPTDSYFTKKKGSLQPFIDHYEQRMRAFASVFEGPYSFDEIISRHIDRLFNEIM